jgi:hypothetical protein
MVPCMESIFQVLSTDRPRLLLKPSVVDFKTSQESANAGADVAVWWNSKAKGSWRPVPLDGMHVGYLHSLHQLSSQLSHPHCLRAPPILRDWGGGTPQWGCMGVTLLVKWRSPIYGLMPYWGRENRVLWMVKRRWILGSCPEYEVVEKIISLRWKSDTGLTQQPNKDMLMTQDTWSTNICIEVSSVNVNLHGLFFSSQGWGY